MNLQTYCTLPPGIKERTKNERAGGGPLEVPCQIVRRLMSATTRLDPTPVRSFRFRIGRFLTHMVLLFYMRGAPLPQAWHFRLFLSSNLLWPLQILGASSEFQATIHDEAHCAFMTLSPYTGTKECQSPPLSSGSKLFELGLS